MLNIPTCEGISKSSAPVSTRMQPEKAMQDGNSHAFLSVAERWLRKW